MSVPVFDAQHTVKKQPGRDYRDDEDEALTVWVKALWEELYSRDETPVPPCPRCASESTRLMNRATQRRAFPLFHCRDCNRMYSRISGSPLQRLRHPWKIPEFIRLLSQPISLDEAGRRMGMDYPAVSNWLMRFRELMALHDSDGTWLARVKLGLKYRPVGVCGRCGYEGTFHYGGFTPENRRRVICPDCKRTWMIDDASDHCVEMRLTSDPSETAAQRVRKAGRQAPTLPTPESGVMVVNGRTPQPSLLSSGATLSAGRLAILSQPKLIGDRKRTEPDETLTEFLTTHLDRVFSPDTCPPDCPHCIDSDVYLSVEKERATGLPRFLCRNCGRSFTRMTGTGINRSMRRETVIAVCPWLSCECSISHAARMVGLSPEALTGWVRRFRQWLLRLDPSGEMERKVRLGRSKGR